MSSINKVILLGRLGADPEIRYTTDGRPVASFRMATSESYKDKSENWQEKTEWHSIVAWRFLAERVGEKLKKGSLVYIEGKIQSREYEGKDGTKRRVFEIVASEVKPIADGKAQSGGNQDRRYAGAPSGTVGDDFVPEIEDDIPM